MMRNFQSLVDRILTESAAAFEDKNELTAAVMDEKFENEFDNLQKDADLVRRLKNTDAKVLDNAITGIYEDYIEGGEATQAPETKKFAECVFNFLKELKNLKEKVV